MILRSLSQECDTKNVTFYPYQYMNGFKNFKEELPSKEMLYSFLEGYKSSDRV